MGRRSGAVLSAVTMLVLSGCANVPPTEEARDPLEPINRVVYTFNDKVDVYVLKPLAQGYRKVVPTPVRRSVNHFFDNLWEPRTIVNDFLQGKFQQGAQDTLRFAFNTTAGIGGLFDVASAMDLPRHEEDFGQTFGRWGIGEGWYLVLPFLGPSTVRDTVGLFPDYALDPVSRHDEVRERNALYALRAIDRRAELLSASRIREEAALDPYLFTRESYRQHRWDRIWDGNPPPVEFD